MDTAVWEKFVELGLQDAAVQNCLALVAKGVCTHEQALVTAVAILVEQNKALMNQVTRLIATRPPESMSITDTPAYQQARDRAIQEYTGGDKAIKRHGRWGE